MSEESKPPLFDVSGGIRVVFESESGNREVHVRYPTDEEWMAHQNAIRVVSRPVGGGVQTRATETDELDIQFVKKIASADYPLPELDGAEAGHIVSRLGRAAIVDVERSGGGYLVVMDVPRARTEHLLRMPTKREERDYSRNAGDTLQFEHGRTETRINISAAGALYDKLIQPGYPKGYAGSVPVVHKATAVSEVILKSVRAVQSGTESDF